ncbi:3-oxoacyl-ACP synthase III family protein [Verrucomicrobiota bacterium]
MPTTVRNKMMQARIKAIEYYLPEVTLTNEKLAAEFSDLTVEKIEEKTGVAVRHIAAENECSSDLGVRAAEKLFASGVCTPQEIDYLLFCTQSPDYFLPTTACSVQDRLGIPKTSGAIDYNLGCSGFVYGLGLAKGLIESGQVSNVLLITAETYSKFIHPDDKSVRTIFGDAAAATLIQNFSAGESDQPYLGPFVYGTDGGGGKNLIVPTSGMRNKRTEESGHMFEDANGNIRSQDNLYMNGSEIFTFTLSTIPKSVKDVLVLANKTIDDIDLFVFHQANKFMLEHLRKKLKIPPEIFFMSFSNYGNTVSSTIPIALKDALNEGKLKAGDTVMLVGFGVGYSWGATLIRWT